jgi:histidyl-tRNA synthetase
VLSLLLFPFISSAFAFYCSLDRADSKVTAEAELLAAIVTFFKRVGITSQDVGIKINSRNVLYEVCFEILQVDELDLTLFFMLCSQC